MSEIRDRARGNIAPTICKVCGLTEENKCNISEGGCVELQEYLDEILSIPELAIVDREAELPANPHIKRYAGALARDIIKGKELGYLEAQQDMAGWVKEIK